MYPQLSWFWQSFHTDGSSNVIKTLHQKKLHCRKVPLVLAYEGFRQGCMFAQKEDKLFENSQAMKWNGCNAHAISELVNQLMWSKKENAIFEVKFAFSCVQSISYNNHSHTSQNQSWAYMGTNVTDHMWKPSRGWVAHLPIASGISRDHRNNA